MVQIIENHTVLTGTLESRREAPDRPGFVILTLRVEKAEAVSGFPNLLADAPGRSQDVLAPASSSAAAHALGPIRLRVRKVSPFLVFADPE